MAFTARMICMDALICLGKCCIGVVKPDAHGICCIGKFIELWVHASDEALTFHV
jgi:hypothetical protein